MIIHQNVSGNVLGTADVSLLVLTLGAAGIDEHDLAGQLLNMALVELSNQ